MSTTASRYVNHKSLVRDLAPVAPPCFEARDQWLTYLESAAAEQRLLHAPGPLLFVKGEPVTFNREFAFCADCTARHSHEMTVAGRCKPEYLLQLLPVREATHAA